MNKISTVSDKMKKHKNIRITKTCKDRMYVQIIKGSNKTVAIPYYLSTDLAYLVAATICDGHIRPDKFTIIFENSDKNVMTKFIQKMSNVFEIKPMYRTVNDKRYGRKLRYRTEITSKPITILLHEVFDVPRGKKSGIVKVPGVIKNSDRTIKWAFIEGVFDTDGGKRQKCFGLSSASKIFRDDMVKMLSEFGFSPRMDEWVNKKYDKKYYGLSFKNLHGNTQVAKLANI